MASAPFVMRKGIQYPCIMSKDGQNSLCHEEGHVVSPVSERLANIPLVMGKGIQYPCIMSKDGQKSLCHEEGRPVSPVS